MVVSTISIPWRLWLIIGHQSSPNSTWIIRTDLFCLLNRILLELIVIPTFNGILNVTVPFLMFRVSNVKVSLVKTLDPEPLAPKGGSLSTKCLLKGINNVSVIIILTVTMCHQTISTEIFTVTVCNVLACICMGYHEWVNQSTSLHAQQHKHTVNYVSAHT